MENPKIELNPQDAELFKLFRKHQDEFKILIEAGFFGFKNGSGIIYRDPEGILKDVDIKARTFTRRKKFKRLKIK